MKTKIVFFMKTNIIVLNKAINKYFVMKHLGVVKKILEMNIIRDHSKRMLWMSQKRYIKKVIERFNMYDKKPTHIPLPGHLKLGKTQCPKNDEEKEKMSKMSYYSVVGSLLCAMVYMRPDIGYIVGVLNRLLLNIRKKHLNALNGYLDI